MILKISKDLIKIFYLFFLFFVTNKPAKELAIRANIPPIPSTPVFGFPCVSFGLPTLSNSLLSCSFVSFGLSASSGGVFGFSGGVFGSYGGFFGSSGGFLGGFSGFLVFSAFKANPKLLFSSNLRIFPSYPGISISSTS